MSKPWRLEPDPHAKVWGGGRRATMPSKRPATARATETEATAAGSTDGPAAGSSGTGSAMEQWISNAKAMLLERPSQDLTPEEQQEVLATLAAPPAGAYRQLHSAMRGNDAPQWLKEDCRVDEQRP